MRETGNLRPAAKLLAVISLAATLAACGDSSPENDQPPVTPGPQWDGESTAVLLASRWRKVFIYENTWRLSTAKTGEVRSGEVISPILDEVNDDDRFWHVIAGSGETGYVRRRGTIIAQMDPDPQQYRIRTMLQKPDIDPFAGLLQIDENCLEDGDIVTVVGKAIPGRYAKLVNTPETGPDDTDFARYTHEYDESGAQALLRAGDRWARIPFSMLEPASADARMETDDANSTPSSSCLTTGIPAGGATVQAGSDHPANKASRADGEDDLPSVRSPATSRVTPRPTPGSVMPTLSFP